MDRPGGPLSSRVVGFEFDTKFLQQSREQFKDPSKSPDSITPSLPVLVLRVFVPLKADSAFPLLKNTDLIRSSNKVHFSTP